ncbi:MAG: hypothetical protein PHR64_03015 [Candidatus Shapirobacteria bacterium]|nr:hypothetical protein [Candidatus Shapirobacteria bacterium]MDD5481888.1 hypothetical protein [Candidatus Shapirobacteria bacterium]
MKKNSLILIIVVAIGIGGLAFWGGVQYQKKQVGNPQFGQFSDRVREMPVRNGASGLGQVINGQIISAEDETITLKTQEGNTKIVIYANSTLINKTSQGSFEDLKVGEQIMVVGSEDASGMITAQNISIGENRAFLGRPENPEVENSD